MATGLHPSFIIWTCAVALITVLLAAVNTKRLPDFEGMIKTSRVKLAIGLLALCLIFGVIGYQIGQYDTTRDSEEYNQRTVHSTDPNS
jgi:hypothetical protein